MEAPLVEVLNRLTREWAPAMLELGITMTWYDSIARIVSGILAALICWLVTPTLIRALYALDDDDRTPASSFTRCVLSAVVVIIAGLTFLFCGILDYWVWIGVFDPKIKLAHDIFESIVK